MARTSTATRSRQPRQEKREEAAPLALAEREQHPIVAELRSRIGAVERVLPRHMDPDRFQSIVLRAVVDNPDLLTCTPQSVVAAVMQAAQEGLEPTGSIGGAWLVPFFDKGQRKAQLIRDYRGLSRMAIRSGAAKRIEAHAVRRGDQFEYELGTNPHVTHRPLVANGGEVIAFYAVAWLPDGSQLVEVMSTDQVNAIREKSKAKDVGPWKTIGSEDWIQMGRKTTIKRIVNYLPLSPEQRERIHSEDVAEFGDALAPVVRVSPVEQRGDLRQRAAQRAAQLTAGNEQPAQSESGSAPTGDAEPSGDAPGGSESTPAPAESAETAPAEPDLSLEEATMAVYTAAANRGLLGDKSGEDAWAVIDQIATEAIPDTATDDLTVADWLAIRDRINGGEFSPPTARPRSGS